MHRSDIHATRRKGRCSLDDRRIQTNHPVLAAFAADGAVSAAGATDRLDLRKVAPAARPTAETQCARRTTSFAGYLVASAARCVDVLALRRTAAVSTK
jgi:hypothetical protein